jgi:MFS family permease
MGVTVPADNAAINWRAAAAAIATISVVGTALGLGVPLLSISMEKAGHSATIIGANTAVGGIGALMAAPFGPRIAKWAGLAPAMLACVMTTGFCFIAFYLLPSIEVWFALRLLQGFAVTLLFLFSEYWMSAAAPPARRGLLFGIYATVLSLGFAAGPALFAAIGSDGFAPFAIGAAIAALAVVPILMAWKESVPVGDGSVGGFLPFLWLLPVSTAAVLVYGSVETGGFALFPVYGTRHGLSETDAALLLTAIGLGNVLLQIPIGLISDKVSDRRLVLLACGIIGLAGMIALPFAIGAWWAAAALLFVWGGVVAGLYTVGLAYLSSRVAPENLAQANAAFVFCYGVGMFAGPQLIGASMDVFGRDGFAHAVALFFAAYVAVAAGSLLRSRTGTPKA